MFECAICHKRFKTFAGLDRHVMAYINQTAAKRRLDRLTEKWTREWSPSAPSGRRGGDEMTDEEIAKLRCAAYGHEDRDVPGLGWYCIRCGRATPQGEAASNAVKAARGEERAAPEPVEE